MIELALGPIIYLEKHVFCEIDHEIPADFEYCTDCFIGEMTALLGYFNFDKTLSQFAMISLHFMHTTINVYKHCFVLFRYLI